MSEDDQQHVPAQSGRPPATEPREAFTELGRILLDEVPLAEVMHRVAELAKATVPGAHEVSVTMVEGGRARSVAFTGDLAVHLDERQYEDGFSPCMDASREGRTINIPDLDGDDRYPGFSAVATRAGVRSSLSVGMPVPERVVGGLNLYATSAGAFDESSVELATVFAEYAAVALVNAALVESKVSLARQLETAMASRAVIEQAKGVLMGRLRCTPDEAFAHLSHQSQRTNRKLSDLAAQLVADVQLAEEP